eukprot:3336978-Amphidinium_carterae.1
MATSCAQKELLAIQRDQLAAGGHLQDLRTQVSHMPHARLPYLAKDTAQSLPFQPHSLPQRFCTKSGKNST